MQLVHPEALEPAGPLVQRADPGGVGTVEHLPAVPPHVDEPDLPKHAEVLRDGRLLQLHRVDDVADGSLLERKVIENLPSGRLGNGVEAVGCGSRASHWYQYMPIKEYVKPGIVCPSVYIGDVGMSHCRPMLSRMIRLRPSVWLMVVLVALVGALVAPLAQRAAEPPEWPGAKGKGVILLPNGWRIAPAGRTIAAGDFPMAMLLSADGRYAIVSNNGWSKPSLTVVDLAQQAVRARVPVEHAWLGLAWHPSGDRLYSSGAAENTVNEFRWENARLTAAPPIVIAKPVTSVPWGTTDLAGTGFIGGLAMDRSGDRLFAVHVLGRAISAIDVNRRTVRRTVDLPAEPYTAILSQDGRTVYVSLWGGARVLALDPETLATKGEVTVGEHPNAMTLSRDGRRLFVACANTNKVWAIELPGLVAREQISVALYPNAPAGTTPNALALSPDGKTLAVANADNNSVALVDVENPAASEVEGFIPTGWYPTAVQFTPDGRRLIVLSGKGLTGQANPRGPQPTSPAADGQYAAQLLQGALSIVDVPDAEALKGYTQRVYAVTPYSDATRLAPANAPMASPIPRKVGETSPIKYVFYVIRENRTYDPTCGTSPRAPACRCAATASSPSGPSGGDRWKPRSRGCAARSTRRIRRTTLKSPTVSGWTSG